jgi:ABC-type Fe3+-hydroxamate transport system substrate-binding protein
MHNLISYNQLAGWKESFQNLGKTLDKTAEESNLINDYYNCLIECYDNQSSCKRICREVLRE